jgi:hypothetical protein
LFYNVNVGFVWLLINPLYLSYFIEVKETCPSNLSLQPYIDHLQQQTGLNKEQGEFTPILELIKQ